MYYLFFAFCFLTIVSTPSYAVCEVGHEKVIVLGHSGYNVSKFAFVHRLFNDTDFDEKAFASGIGSTFFALHSDDSGIWETQFDQNLVWTTFAGAEACTVIVSSKGTDEMSLDELDIFRELIYFTNTGLIVVEFGYKTLQTIVILKHTTFCWGSATLDLDVSNHVSLCNDIKTTEIPLLQNVKTIHNVENPNNAYFLPITSAWPTFFPSAMAAELKKKRPSRKTSQPSPRELYYKPVRRPLQTEKFIVVHPGEDKKVLCKYRKSCYETGMRPVIKYNLFASDVSVLEETNEFSKDDIIDDITELKVRCKYRPTCYADAGIEMNESNEKKNQLFLALKKTPVSTEKPKTLREVAKEAVEMAEKRNQNQTKYTKFNLYFDENEEKLSKKNRCKYRKSCYETDVIPKLEETFTIPTWLTLPTISGDVFNTIEKAESPPSKKLNEQLKNEQKKNCKYRKSCYISGKLPESLHEKKFIVQNIIEQHTIQPSKEVRCKYRKSCYESGIVPNFKIPTPAFVEEEKPKSVPTTLNDLKVHCKYRKSCYQEMAEKAVNNNFNSGDDGEDNDGDNEDDKAKKIEVDKTKNDDNDADKNLFEELEETEKNNENKNPTLTATETVEIVRETIKSVVDKIIEAKPISKKVKSEKQKPLPLSVIEKNAEETVTSKVKKSKVLKLKKPEPSPVEKSENIVNEVFVKASFPKLKKSKKGKKVVKPVVEPDLQAEEGIEEIAEVSSPKSKKSKKIKTPVVDVEIEDELIRPKKSKKVPKILEKINEVSFEALTERADKAMQQPEDDYKQKKILLPLLPVKINENEKLSIKSGDTKPSKLVTSIKDQADIVVQKVDVANLNVDTKNLCKYRKSCYETGKLKQPGHHTWLADGEEAIERAYAIVKNEIRVLTTDELRHRSEEHKKLACKFRKSCYKTGILPTLEDRLHVEHSVENFSHDLQDKIEVIEHDEHNHRALKKKKLSCKFRKSCYKSGKLPVIESMFGISAATNIEKPTSKAEDWLMKTVEEKKVDCRYRKSCYDNGVLPKNIDESTVKTAINSIKKNSKETVQQRCRYRKSCYSGGDEINVPQKNHAAVRSNKPPVIDEDTLIVKIPKETIQKAFKPKQAELKSGDTSETSENVEEKPVKKQKKSPKTKSESDDDDDNEKQYKELPKKILVSLHESNSKSKDTEQQLSSAEQTKLDVIQLAKNTTSELKVVCKYRHSCYATTARGELPLEQLLRIKGKQCSLYRNSCRQKLGLPPVVRAPIGPNGRKLCRRKKPDEKKF